MSKRVSASCPGAVTARAVADDPGVGGVDAEAHLGRQADRVHARPRAVVQRRHEPADAVGGDLPAGSTMVSMLM